MRKTVCALILAILLIPVAVSAEIDLGSMSDDELVSLKEQLVSEMKDRGSFKKLAVPQGKYIVGIDIPSGDYSVCTIDYSSTVCIFVNDATSYMVSSDTPVGKLSLSDGDAVSVLYGTLFFSKYTGLGF